MGKIKGREMIAKRVAQEFEKDTVVNLGIGLPTLCANYISKETNIMLQSENGFVGIGPFPFVGEEDYDLINAGGVPVTIVAGGAFFDSAISFGIIRGGHIHSTVLGAFEVDESGNLANWMVPGKIVPGMGGAMDLVIGSRKVIVAMEHSVKGKPKILKKCTLPLTARNVVDLIVTDLAVIQVTSRGLILKEIAPNLAIEDVIKVTEADLIIPEEVKVIDVF